jgi:thioredoxin-like negative regulator of GroEL
MPQLSSPLSAPFDGYSEAKQLMRERKWVEAIVLLRSALKKAPRSQTQNIELDLARAMVYSGRREEALTVLSQMINGRKGAAQKQLIQRVRVLSRVFLTNATFQTYQDGVNFLLIRKYRAAREKFEKALESDAANVETLTRIGQCLVLDGDVDSAAERLRVARRLDPYEPEIRLWLGHALFERGEMRDALSELKAAYMDLGSSELAAVWYAEALMGASQKAAATQILEDDLKRHPDHVWGLITLSRYRLVSASSRDIDVAWQARKDLQLALSRISIYLPPAENDVPPVLSNASASTAGTGSSPAVREIDPMGDLALNLRQTEPELRHEITKLMEEADSRIEGGSSQQ